MADPGPVLPDVEDRDPGLAQERTDLAWTRTAISFVALGTAMARTNLPAGALVMISGGVVWTLGHLSAGRRAAPRRRTVQLITVVTTLTALLGALLSVTA